MANVIAGAVSGEYFVVIVCLTIVTRARDGCESIAHEAEGRVGFYM